MGEVFEKIINLFRRQPSSWMWVENKLVTLNEIGGKHGYPDKRKTAKGKRLLEKLDPKVLLYDEAIKENVNFIKLTCGRLRAISKGRLLDLGCGGGDYYQIFKLAKSPLSKMEYFGCEINDALIKTARIRYPKTHFIKGYAQEIDCPATYYDIVFSSGVIQYTLQDWVKVIKEISRVCSRYVIISRLPLTDKKTFYVKQTVTSIFGTEVRFFVVINKADFKKNLKKYGLEAMTTSKSKETFGVEGIKGLISSYQLLLKVNRSKDTSLPRPVAAGTNI
ncbi:hypothetical protein A2875_02300 [Candidatus Gottesmanbacteria bacterium RIFCSPHIGHO2_01_FULL_46_14]|uniref:Methyltransferase type 11 domain-containing protein n=2 Tax=Patescibacteria group TaxID=1783273 RepID=A0A1F5ZMY1_9BACT|nr:MAG: hypothetical protein UT57_C0013G0005 [Microgenomates group bacterium GW2011_GWC1_39_7]KKU74657.1 MAG: hypothetical protein UY01_C0029G0003 [Candidatus Nomurabacteria bacterium GW2011_GWB1_47_6]OGG13713.1 MAG: hypothetical protein A2875_02300 [Candidatus Gottesmanbacteria bacterium RIFCSPHIGHO2_01_FULL_46_14]